MSNQGVAIRRYDVVLSCDHPATFTHACPEANDVVWCARCARYRLYRPDAAERPATQG
jgi:hypothetical protein